MKVTPYSSAIAHKVTRLPAKKPVDYREKEMVRLSDQSQGTDWDSLKGQWEILWVVKLNAVTEDDFGNYPRIVYSVFNPRTGNEVIMGRYDVRSLLPHKTGELRSLGNDRKQQQVMVENLKAAHFKLKAQEVLKGLSLAQDVDIDRLRTGIASLVFLSELLSSGDRVRFMAIVNKLHESDGSLLSDSDLNFLVYKPQERCVTYKELGRLFPHLKRIVDGEIATKLATWRADRSLSVFRTFTGNQAHRQLDADVKKEEKRLQSDQDLSYLDVYQMECNYREKASQPLPFE